MKPRKLKHKNLTRIDHPAKRAYGYFVRIQWKGERERHSTPPHAEG